MNRKTNLGLGLGLGLVLIGGCPSDGGQADTETDGASTGTSSSATEGPDATGVDDSTGDPTGGPGSGLVSCDPTEEMSCAEGVCAGAPQAGFYCRPACSDTAEPGTSCGSDDVCLPVGAGNEGLACFDVADCDLLTADGCDIAAGESCVAVSLEPVRTACVPSGNTGASLPCDPLGMHDCGPGLACLGSDFEGGDPGVCTLLCLPQEALPAECATCIPLNPDIGTCTECSALDDQCPRGQQCQPTNEFLGGICVDHGTGGPGDPCVPGDPTMACLAGHLCLEGDVDDAFICVETCDPAMPMCSGDETCLDVGVIVPGADPGQLGLCIAGTEQYCDPDAMPTGCVIGDVCLAFDVGIGVCGSPCDPTAMGKCDPNEFCFPELDGAPFYDPYVAGNGACGDGCATDGECGGGTCLRLDALTSTGVCGVTCDPANGAADCGVGEGCVPTPGDPMVGACVLGGTACDPASSGECAPPTGACVALEGAASGVCLQSCFVQDPSACMGAGVCHGKTDPQWHGGVCLGGGAPCDPVAQDCGPGMTCEVSGGGPIGGTALLCIEAGALPEGGDCSADDGACGEGLYCVADVCVATCDPGGPPCAMGICTDLSAQFYLPLGTVGVCL
jgi:hypothetical protein